MNMDIDLGAIRHHSTARARRNANVEPGKEQTWEYIETPRREQTEEEVDVNNRININSEDDLLSNYEIDSNAPDFLEMKLPVPKVSNPACFCEGGNYCKKHQSKAPDTNEMFKLIQSQIQDVVNNQLANEDILSQMGAGISEMFITRKHTFQQKLIEAYVQKDAEATKLREQVEMLLSGNNDFRQIQCQLEEMETENLRLK